MKHNTLGITHAKAKLLIKAKKKKSRKQSVHDLCNMLEQVICILNQFASKALCSLQLYLLPGCYFVQSVLQDDQKKTKDGEIVK